MITLNSLHRHWITAATAPSARRLWRTWTTHHPELAELAGPVAAIASTTDKSRPNAPVLNAFLALSAEHPLARHGILEAFTPWIGRYLAGHVVPSRERDDQLSLLVTGFLHAAVSLAPKAPLDWPASTIVQVAEGPVRNYYKRFAKLAQPYGDQTDLERTHLPVVTIRPERVHRHTGEELVLAGLCEGVIDKTISLENANLVAGVVIGGRTAQELAPSIYVAERTAQWRVRKIGHQLAERAAERTAA